MKPDDLVLGILIGVVASWCVFILAAIAFGFAHLAGLA